MELLALVTLAASGCSSSPTGVTSFELPTAVISVYGQYPNGDVAMVTDVGRHRFTRTGHVRGEDLPGFKCEPAPPAANGTEYVRCAHLYRREPGGDAWERVVSPVGVGDFLFEGRDGARYHRVLASSASFAAVKPSGEVVPLDQVNDLEASTAGDVVATLSSGGYALVTDGVVGPTLPASDVPALWRENDSAKYFIDGAGHYIFGTGQGTFARLDLATGHQDDGWISAAASKNPNITILGVTSSGRLVARSEVNGGAAYGQPDNEIEPGVIISIGHGESEWRRESPAINSIFYEQPLRAFFGRSDEIWLTACIANCSPDSSAPQAVVFLLGDSLDREPIQTRYRGTVGVAVAVDVPVARQANVRANDTCAAISVPLLGNTVGVSCNKAGTHRLTFDLFNDRSQKVGEHAVTLTIDAPPPPERASATRSTFEMVVGPNGDLQSGVWIDPSGVVSVQNGGPHTIPEIVGAKSVGEVPIGYPVLLPVILTEAGQLYKVDHRTVPFQVTALAAPPAAAVSSGYFLGTDGQVYPLQDNPTAVAGLTAIKRLECRTSFSNSPGRSDVMTGCIAYDDSQVAKEFGVSNVSAPTGPTDVVLPDAVNVGCGAFALGTDGSLLLAPRPDALLVSLSRVEHCVGSAAYYSENGNTYLAPISFFITAAGEVWGASFDGQNAGGAELPAGSVADRVEPALGGALVWLQDGRVGRFEFGPLGGRGWVELSVSIAKPVN